MTTGTLSIDRVRAWLRSVAALLADRAGREAALEREHGEATDRARREHDSAVEAIELRCREGTRDAESSYREAESRITSVLDLEERTTRRAEEVERERIAEKGLQGETAARRQWDEAIWAAETVYEAKEQQPAEQFAAARNAVEGILAEMDGLEEKAQRLLRRSHVGTAAAAGDGGAIDDPQAALDTSAESARTAFAALERRRLLRLFAGLRPLLLPVLPAVAAAAITGAVQGWSAHRALALAAGAALLASLAATAWLYAVLRSAARARFRALAGDAARARRAGRERLAQAEAQRVAGERALRETRDREIREADAKFGPILRQIQERRARHLARIDEKYPAMLRDIAGRRERDLAANRTRYQDRIASTEREHARDLEAARRRFEQASDEERRRYEDGWSRLVRDWTGGITAAREEAAAIDALDGSLFPPWTDPAWAGWRPGSGFAPAVRFGRLDVDLAALPGGLPSDPRLDVPGPVTLSVPALLSFPDRCSLLLAPGPSRARGVQTLQAVMMRLLTGLPPGKVRFTIIDPVGLGRNFAGFMHLADYSEALVGGKIWTDARHIETRLVDLTEHMENVIQKYLRNEYESIAAYNREAGEIAEPYRFVVICDFPAGFTEAAAQRLASVVASGPRCGVYTLISLAPGQEMPRGITPADLREHSVTIAEEGGRFLWKDPDFEGLPLELDPPPPEPLVTQALKLVGEAALDATRVEVPFDFIAPPPERVWSLDARRELRVALGRSGATRLQHLALGQGTNQHALVAGRTGSGKSTLLHVLITNLALWYPPDEVEFYLVDFKKGVEFKTYVTHELPHARAVAIESDREFGLSVLHRLDQELKRRGALFRRLGVQDLAGFQAAGGEETLPRTLLIIDEFQEFFTEDDRIAQDAALLLDRLVRQGRAFGIHVLLGSQTLGGAYTLARSTLGQMGVRIALQCSETDSYLILSDDNGAARLLARPGEAIYNDANGSVEGNSPFQIVWLPEAVREAQLGRVAALARERGHQPAEPRIVFEGNAAADPSANPVLAAWLRSAPASPPVAWLGEPVAIKDPTSVRFARRGGSNLLLAGQREDAVLAMMSVAILGLAAQLPPAEAQFVLLDGTPADSPHAGYLARLAAGLPHEAQAVEWRGAADAIARLHAECARRIESGRADVPSVFVLINGIQRFRQLRRSEDEFSFSSGDEKPSPGRQLSELLRDGPPCGIHFLVWCDTVTALERTFERQALQEFESRVLFQMSAADSTSLIDSAAGSKLGFQRALLASEEHGTLEKFRPWALPPEPWLGETLRHLSARAATALRR
jgi:hypothetical protein